MDIFDYFDKIQRKMMSSMAKSIKDVNKSFSQKYKKPSCEISQSKDFLNIKFDLPGISKNEVVLNITHEYLEIIAEKKSEKVKRSKKGYREERSFLGYRRMIPLPPGLKIDNTVAKFSRGKLNMKIPKAKVGKVKIK